MLAFFRRPIALNGSIHQNETDAARPAELFAIVPKRAAK